MSRAARVAAPRKTIFDPVHGTVVLDEAALALVNTPEFQRLWGIRQTGFAHLVFPGANHTRLEHSLGTYWVAGQMAETLGLDANAAALLRTAALLHDLGHGPFSHTFDASMEEALGHGHERLSRARILGIGPAPSGEIPRLLERHGLRPREVADLVDPAGAKARPRWWGGLLHGAVDADRIDYLQRDAHYTGVAHGAIDAVRLLQTLRRAGPRVVFAEKGRGAVEGFLVGRALMYQTVYYHKTVRSAEAMAQAALERSPGFPETARATFGWTDAEWLVRLPAAGGRTTALVEGILARRLYKRVFGWPKPARGELRRWQRLLDDPPRRRALEDDLAARLGAPPGTVLLDLASLAPRGDPAREWGEIALYADGRTTFPFREPSLWLLLATRAPADSAITVFADPRYAEAAGRLLARDPSVLP